MFDDEYEPLLSATSVPVYLQGCASKECPTCKGSGKSEKEHDNLLIAFIPLSDTRLKENKMWLWVLLVIILSIVGFIVGIFLLIPRDISFKSTQSMLKPTNLTLIKDTNLNETIGLIIEFNATYKINNKNYYKIQIESIVLDINRNSRVTQPKIKFDKTIIYPRQIQTLNIHVIYPIYTHYDPYANLCIDGIIRNLFSLISATFEFSTFWSSKQQLRIDSTEYIVCKHNISILYT